MTGFSPAVIATNLSARFVAAQVRDLRLGFRCVATVVLSLSDYPRLAASTEHFGSGSA